MAEGFRWRGEAAAEVGGEAGCVGVADSRGDGRKAGQSQFHAASDGGPEWAVPLVLIPVEDLHEGQKYSAERGKKYRDRLKQLTPDDVALWKDRVDEFGGTQLDAAVNIILLHDYFDKEEFQRDKFKAAIGARKK